jgi:cell division protease FtsH
LPDVRGREGILKIHARNVPLAEEVDLNRVAQATPGLSGADLANLINEAALFASRKGRNSVDRSDIEEANDKVMMGAERRSILLTDEDKMLSAYHEAGHALVAKSVPESQKIGKATIIPRGRAMGLVSFLPDERRSMTETRLKAHLATALGGCCAERIIFSERSTGAQSDYKQVASLARSMVCDWGMNQELGPIALSNRDEEVFLGKGFAQAGNLSEETTQIVDREIRRLVQEAEATATEILRNRIGDLHTIAKALLKYEVLDDTELDTLLDRGVLEIDGNKKNGKNLSNSNSLDETGK